MKINFPVLWLLFLGGGPFKLEWIIIYSLTQISRLARSKPRVFLKMSQNIWAFIQSKRKVETIPVHHIKTSVPSWIHIIILLGWDLAIARYQPRPCGQQGGFAPTFFLEKYLAKVNFLEIFLVLVNFFFK